jgi:hypothetical protein
MMISKTVGHVEEEENEKTMDENLERMDELENNEK